MEDLRNKHVLVTGATGGLGAPVVEALVACGATVTATARRRTALDELRARLRHHDRLSIADSDPTDRAGTAALVDAIERGTGPLWGVVHCVGGFAAGALVETGEETVERLVSALFRSTVIVTREAIRVMQPRRAGRIVLIGSLASRTPSPNASVYGSLKSAVEHFALSIAAEAKGSGIRVNVVLPGTMDTEANRDAMPSADRSSWVAPMNVAKAIVALMGDGGQGVSGALVAIPEAVW